MVKHYQDTQDILSRVKKLDAASDNDFSLRGDSSCETVHKHPIPCSTPSIETLYKPVLKTSVSSISSAGETDDETDDDYLNTSMVCICTCVMNNVPFLYMTNSLMIWLRNNNEYSIIGMPLHWKFDGQLLNKDYNNIGCESLKKNFMCPYVLFIAGSVTKFNCILSVYIMHLYSPIYASESVACMTKLIN